MGDGRFTKNDPRRAKGGRPKLAEELRARCLKAVDEHVLTYWLDEVTEREREIITPAGPMTMVCRGSHAAKCSELLAAYGMGKPMQPTESKIDVTHRGEWNLDKMSPDELRHLRAMAVKAGADAESTEH